MTTKRSRPRRPVEPADRDTTVTPPSSEAAVVAPVDSAPSALSGDELTEVILRFLRRSPNSTVDLAPLAEELGVEPFAMQVHVERMARRGLVVTPFIEPGSAGGATLSEGGLRWLIAREGGVPRDIPTAFKKAEERVRAEDEAARLPRAQVYGVRGG